AWANHVCELIADDPDKAHSLVELLTKMQVCRDMPEDACIGDKASHSFVESNAAASALLSLLNPSISADLNMGGPDTVGSISGASLGASSETSVSSAVGMAIMDEVGRSAKLSAAVNALKPFEEHAPEIAEEWKYSNVDVAQLAADRWATELGGLIGELSVLEAEVPETYWSDASLFVVGKLRNVSAHFLSEQTRAELRANGSAETDALTALRRLADFPIDEGRDSAATALWEKLTTIAPKTLHESSANFKPLLYYFAKSLTMDDLGKGLGSVKAQLTRKPSGICISEMPAYAKVYNVATGLT
ncbi:unnamed protein product, partial [Prorocentrum cordatum]